MKVAAPALATAPMLFDATVGPSRSGFGSGIDLFF